MWAPTVVPITRPQRPFAIGQRGGVFRIRNPKPPTAASSPPREGCRGHAADNRSGCQIRGPGATAGGSGRCRVRRHIAVNQPSTAMLDHHPYVQEPGRCSSRSRRSPDERSLRSQSRLRNKDVAPIRRARSITCSIAARAGPRGSVPSVAEYHSSTSATEFGYRPGRPRDPVR